MKFHEISKVTNFPPNFRHFNNAVKNVFARILEVLLENFYVHNNWTLVLPKSAFLCGMLSVFCCPLSYKSELPLKWPAVLCVRE